MSPRLPIEKNDTFDGRQKQHLVIYLKALGFHLRLNVNCANKIFPLKKCFSPLSPFTLVPKNNIQLDLLAEKGCNICIPKTPSDIKGRLQRIP